MPTDYAIVMIRKAREQGADLLEGVPFTLAELEESEFMPITHYEVVIGRFFRLLPDDDSGFALGQVFSMANHGPLGFGAMSAPTIRDGLTFLARYLPTRTNYASCCVEYRHRDLHLILDLDQAALPLLRRHCEVFSVIFQSYIESAGAPADSIIWRFPYAVPQSHLRYRTWLRGEYSFGAPHLRIEVPHAVGAVHSAFRNDAGFRSATSQCEEILMEASTVAVIEKVRGILASRMERRVMETVPVTAIPSANEMARHLKSSRRTLIRQLKEAGTAFQTLKDELLREHLTTLLRDQRLPMEQVAERLGYAEAANFTRACRRLFGATPSELRARLATATHNDKPPGTVGNLSR